MKTGDAIHAFAHPVARSIDAIWGSDLSNCGGCNKMRENLNSGMGFWNAVKERFQSTKGETMQFQVQTVVEAESVQDALAKLASGTVISITPRPQQPVRNPALAAMQQSGQVVNMKTGEPHGI